jgi:hypothetical protein
MDIWNYWPFLERTETLLGLLLSLITIYGLFSKKNLAAYIIRLTDRLPLSQKNLFGEFAPF